MNLVAKKRRRAQRGLTYYDDDDDDATPKRRTTDSNHLHTSITITASGISTRTCRIATADPSANQQSKNVLHRLTKDISACPHPIMERQELYDFEEDEEAEVFETLHPESFVDIHEFIDARKIRKRTASVSHDIVLLDLY